MRFTTCPEPTPRGYYEGIMAFAMQPDGKPTEVSEKVYWYFLNIMPPLEFDGNRFLVCEAMSHTANDEAVHLQFVKLNGKYYAKYVVQGRRETYIRGDNLDGAYDIEPRLDEVYSYD